MIQKPDPIPQPCVDCGTMTCNGLQCLRCETAATPLPKTERQEQKEVFDWCKLHGLMPIRIANEMARRRRQEATKGVADFMLMEKPPLAPQWRSVFVEMKQRKRGKWGEEQKRFATHCRRNGSLYLLCKGAADAISQLEALGFAEYRFETEQLPSVDELKGVLGKRE